MRSLCLLFAGILLTSSAFANPKVEEKIVRSPGHTTIIYKDYSAPKAKKTKAVTKVSQPEVEFREYDVGGPQQQWTPPPRAARTQAPVAIPSRTYSQSYTPGPNRGMAANGGGSFSSGMLFTNPGFFPGWGFGPNLGFGPGFGPGLGWGVPYAPRPGRVRAVVPSGFVGFPTQRFGPPPFIGPGSVVGLPGGYRGGFRGFRGGFQGGFRGGCRR